MAFTKINAAGIGTTETVTVDGLTVINDGSFGGNLTVSGVLTYEDVTNVDSVGLITARNGIVVGSGITLSKDGDIFATGITTVSGNVKVGTGITLSPDGDVFFTGIATGNGSGLTALNASNLASGTVPTARLGSGTASSSTFLRGDSTFAAVTSTTINNNANNRVITGSGTANTLEGEANLQFDGTNIGVGVAPSGVSSYSTIHLKGQTSGNGGAVRLTDYGDTPDSDDFTIYKNSAAGYLRINGTDPLIAYLNGSDRVRIDSSGRVMIGTDTEGEGTADDLTIATSGATGITIRSGTTSEGNIFFSDGTSGADEYRGTIQYNHSQNFMQFATDGSERMRIMSDGRVSIGGMAPDTGVNLHIESSGEANFLLEGSASTVGGYLMLKNKDNTANSSMSIQFLDASGQGVSELSGVAQSDANNQGYLAIKTRDSGASMIEAARFASDNTFHLASTGSDDIVYSMQTGRAQHSNSQSKTYRITGLAWGQLTFSIGVGDGNYKRAHVVVKLGGSQWSTSNSAYNATVEINDASGINVSFNKETTYYDVIIANAGNSNTIYGAWTLEASNYSNLGKPTLTIS